MSSEKIDYQTQGDGEPVIFLHGIGGSADSFFEQLHLYTEDESPSNEIGGLDNYQRIAWNMPGYGESSAQTWPPTFESLSTSLHHFLAELNLQRVHLVGQSIGGMLAIEHAIRYPDQVASLSLIATTPSFGGKDKNFKNVFLKARLAPLENGKSMAELASVTARKLVGPTASADTINEIETILANVSEAAWRGILECLVTFNRRNDLASIMQPCCVIAGGYDLNAPAKTMEKMSKSLPYAQFHLIEQAGHMINQEFAEQTNHLLSQFLNQHSL